MAPVRKIPVKKVAGGAVVPQRTAVAKISGLTLPTEKSKPSSRLGDYTWLIYGAKKIGKTSLVAQFPETLILSFEPGTKALEVFQTRIL